MRHLLFFIVTLMISINSYSQSYLSTNGKAIVNESGDTIILKGMGLGGWMLQEGYMLETAGFANAQHKIKNKIQELIGEQNTNEFYDLWLANHVRKIDIDSLKSWGFNSVRLPMHYNLFTLPIEDEPIAGQNTWLEKGFALTDSLISWCKQNEMYVILDLHAAPGGQGRDEGISDYDTSKPSLWESEENQNKTVALWKKLAQTYVDEPWVGGYDLINETNWEMDGNTPLVNLSKEITQAIRTVDDKHIIIIEGNWFANDFTNMTPPWDDNMVYGPHKYWSINDQASIQWVLDIREQYDVPIYLGESGENSNVWFRDAIKLLEEHEIGWAWWPMKKVQSIAGPLSVTKTKGYQDLLDYWNGNGATPSVETAKNVLFELAENLKLENCTYQKDVIDAMFRQTQEDTTIPFKTQKIPGIVYATDFDMGVLGSAYFDSDVANYQVSTGNYTAWNNGWVYRNDGVDIERTEDLVNSNGYNVGWMTTGEWLQYDIDVAKSAIYDVEVRIAANSTDGVFHLTADGADITGPINVPNSNGWQNFQTLIVPNVILNTSDKKLRFHVDREGYNLSSMKFVEKGETTALQTGFRSAITLTNQSVQLNLNKLLIEPIPTAPSGFTIYVNGVPIQITSSLLSSTNTRIITFEVNHTFKSSDNIEISYSGDEIAAFDGIALTSFNRENVENTIAIIHDLPGKIEAEDFFFQSGIQLEGTSDVGGGDNIGYLDAGDYLDYYINVESGGSFSVDYRTASESESGAIELQLIEKNGEVTTLNAVNFPPTGGWQTWATTNRTINLPKGVNQLRVLITQPLFNMNYIEFKQLTTSIIEQESKVNIKVFPNPSSGVFKVEFSRDGDKLHRTILSNSIGQVVWQGYIRNSESINLEGLPNGLYTLNIKSKEGIYKSQKILLQK